MPRRTPKKKSGSKTVGSPKTPTGRTTEPVLQSPVFNDAIRVGKPVPIDDEVDTPRTLRRKFLRQVEVPFVRQVKVPVKTKKVVPTTVKQRVPYKRVVQVPGWKEVEEEYVDIEEQKRVRDKVIWVKKIIQEEYYEDVEVTKKRMVKVPDVTFREIDDYCEVEVPGSKIVTVDGYRIDQVEDTKLVEVEEEQEYTLVPQEIGAPHVVSSREVGVKPSDHHLTRKLGQIYVHNDRRVQSVEEDELPGDYQRISYHTPDPRDPNRRLYNLEDIRGDGELVVEEDEEYDEDAADDEAVNDDDGQLSKTTTTTSNTYTTTYGKRRDRSVDQDDVDDYDEEEGEGDDDEAPVTRAMAKRRKSSSSSRSWLFN